MPFNRTYWGDIPEFLQQNGAIVLIADLSSAHDTHVRAKQLYEQLKAWGYKKYHLVGHSQGGLDARIIFNKDQSLVASITTIGTPHRGSKVADFFYEKIEALPFGSSFVWRIGDVLGCTIGIVSHNFNALEHQGRELVKNVFQTFSLMRNEVSLDCLYEIGKTVLCSIKVENVAKTAKRLQPFFSTFVCNTAKNICRLSSVICQSLHLQNTKRALKCLTTKSLEEFNMKYPHGLCNKNGDGQFYSWGTHGVIQTGRWDFIGITMQLIVIYFSVIKKTMASFFLSQ